MARSTKKRRRPTRGVRLLVLGVVVFAAFLYYQPLASYLDRQEELARRSESRRAASAGDARTPAGGLEEPCRARARGLAGSGWSRRGAPLHRQGRRGLESARAKLRSIAVTDDDRALVERQLGRSPRAFLRVVVRCAGPPGRHRAGAVRRERRAVPDLLPDVSVPRRGHRAGRSGGRRGPLDGGRRTRPPSWRQTSSGPMPSSVR